MSEKINSQRAYFSFRYALPGYTFLTLILLINKDIIFNQIKNLSIEFPDMITLFGIVFAFISLLSGSAIGFIVSQPWYLIYNCLLKRFFILELRPSFKKLINIVDSNDPSKFLSMMDYILLSMINKDITNYINNLFDIINSLASTISAILIGLILGFSLRNLSEIAMYNKYDYLIMRTSLLVVFIILVNLWRVSKEHDSIIKLMIELNECKIRRIFSRIYKLKNWE